MDMGRSPGGSPFDRRVRGRCLLALASVAVVAVVQTGGIAAPAAIGCDVSGSLHYSKPLKTGARFGRVTSDSPSTKKKESLVLSGCHGATADAAQAAEGKKGSLWLSGSYAPTGAALPSGTPSSDLVQTCDRETVSGSYSLSIPLAKGSHRSKGRYIAIRETTAFALLLLGSDGTMVATGTWAAKGTCSSKAGVARASIAGRLGVSPVPDAPDAPARNDSVIGCRLSGEQWYGPPLRQGRSFGLIRTDSFGNDVVETIPLSGCIGANTTQGLADPARRGSIGFEGFFVDTGTLVTLLTGVSAPTGNDACMDEVALAELAVAIPMLDGTWLRSKGTYIAARHGTTIAQVYLTSSLPGALGLVGSSTWSPLFNECGPSPGVIGAHVEGYLVTIPN